MSVLITSPGRLHLSLIDMNGELGRVDGGIGMALNEPSLAIEASLVNKKTEEKENPDEVVSILRRIRNRIEPGLCGYYSIKILKKLPSHAGLGSRTQLSLSIAKAISVLENRNYNAVELARLVGRGGTSGIGTAAFDNGGFILDGGHVFRKSEGEKGIENEELIKTSFLPSSASRVLPPPVIFQHPLPEDWFFVLAIPVVQRGAHGTDEIEIFNQHCPINREEVGKICRIVLMRLLPSLLEKDIATFAESLTMLQWIGFKKIEVELQHDIIKKGLFNFFATHALGYGMSSFGPATYAVVEGQGTAKGLAVATKEFLDENGIHALVCYSNANNKGCEVKY